MVCSNPENFLFLLSAWEISPWEEQARRLGVKACAMADVDAAKELKIRLADTDYTFTAKLAVSTDLPFIAVGDTVTLTTVEPSEDQLVCNVTAITVGEAPQTETDTPAEEQPAEAA